MAFRQIDEAAAYSLASAHSPLLTYLADSGAAALEEATRGAVASFQVLWPPRLHSIPGGSGDDATPAKELGWGLALWRPSTRGKGIKLKTLGTAQAGDLTLGLVVLPFGDFLRRGCPSPATTSAVSEGESIEVLTLDDLDVIAGDLYAVLFTCESQLDTDSAESWHDSNADPASRTAIETWSGSGIHSSASTHWSPDGSSFTAADRNTKPWLVEFLDGDDPRSATVNPGKVGLEPPAGRLGWRADLNTNSAPDGLGGVANMDSVWVWPPIEHEDYLYTPTGLTLRRTPLSYWEIMSVELTEIVAAPGGYGSSLAPDAGFSAGRIKANAIRSAEMATEAGRIHAIAPLPLMNTTDAASMAGYREHAGARVTLSSSYATLQEIPVGDATRYNDGASKALATYRVTLVGHQVSVHGTPRARNSLHLKATLTELDGSGTSVDAEAETEEAAQLEFTSAFSDGPTAATWLAFQGPDITRVPVRHSMRGFWCNEAWFAGLEGLSVLDVEVTDTVAPTGDTRRLLLELKRTRPGGASGDPGAVYFFCSALLVETRGQFRPAADPTV